MCSRLAGFAVQDERITTLRLAYTFGQAYSSLLMSDFDKDENSQLDSTELLALAEALQMALKESRFFSHLAVSRQNIAVETVPDTQASILCGNVRLIFALLLPKPVDPKISQLDFTLYDPSNHVAVIL